MRSKTCKPSTCCMLQIRHDQVELLFFQFLEGQDAAFHRHGVIPFLLEHMVQVFPGDQFIFDDEDLDCVSS